jgi:hypothetical protein
VSFDNIPSDEDWMVFQNLFLAGKRFDAELFKEAGYVDFRSA